MNYIGKKYVAFGDSITAGGYPNLLAKKLGAKLINKGVSGSIIGQNLSDMKKIDYSDVALVTLMTGTNGTGPLGDVDTDIKSDFEENANTFAGNLARFVEYVRCQNPYVKVFLLTPPNTNGGNKDLRKTVEVYKKVGEKISVKVIDVYSNSGVHSAYKSNTDGIYSADGTHLTLLANEMVADYIFSEIW